MVFQSTYQGFLLRLEHVQFGLKCLDFAKSFGEEFVVLLVVGSKLAGNVLTCDS
jgi:hypothetical protein